MKTLCVVALLLVPSLALAQDAEDEDVNQLPMDFDYKSALVAGRDKPCVQITAQADLKRIKVVVARQGKRKAFSVRWLAEGNAKTLCWRERPGRYQYRVTISARVRKATRTRQVEISINYLPPIKMRLSRDLIDLEKRKLTFSLNHPADRAELSIVGKGGKPLQEVVETYGGAGPGTALEMSWNAPKGEVVRMELKAYDSDGFWVGMAITPWAVEIPHEEVEFGSDKWAIRDTEAPKLDAAIKQIHKLLKEHASELVVKLYVGGFTDTVGSKSHNRTLSNNRARAIAAYFKKAGIRVPILYRGYGEEVLAVGTPDNKDEPRNRRAMYVLANQPPMISKKVTWGTWTRLP